ncbi:DUF1800 domain-containing protein [Psychromonas sp. CD1]|uniref:DUF1800 domain-containing protein n=1 Tax=Psychromonas sp. CD1 TaxID=1979839 RepID=UPI000B9B7D7D|nr:DUF1800 domain-containing protein [Psychromonas sp. CD1]
MIDIDIDVFSKDLKQCAKFLYRGTFGPQEEDVNQLHQIGFNAWFAQQYSADVSYHLYKAKEFADLSSSQIDDNIRIGVWWERAIQAPDQLRQRMAYALSQIFVVSKYSVGIYSEELTFYYDILLKHSFGNYRELLEEVTLNPTMGNYLTLNGSEKYDPSKNTNPDENYAREVMQLFSIGLWKLAGNGIPELDDEGNKIPAYSQEDVEELARALTGWHKVDDYQPMQPNEQFHDNESKLILGQHFPERQNAYQDLSQALDVIFQHQNTPIMFATLLIKRFVTSNPRGRYISNVAKVFKNNGQGIRGDLQATLKAVLTDEDVFNGFADNAGKGNDASKHNFGLLKEPILVITNQVRALNMKSVGSRWWNVQAADSNLGQAPLRAKSVFNFYSPSDAPQGEIADLSLTAPEFTLLTTDIMRRLQNRIWSNIVAYNHTLETQWAWDCSEFMNLIKTDIYAYVDLLNERLYAGLMSSELYDYLIDMLETQIPSNMHQRRFFCTIYIASTSPEFFCQE